MAKELGKTCIYNFQFAIHVPGRVWGGTAFAKRSEALKAPSGAFKRQRGLRQQMEGHCPDKHAPTRALRKLAGA